MASLPTLKELAGDIKPVIAYPKSIEFGPVRLDGYMLEGGEFRQSVTSTCRALTGLRTSGWLLIPFIAETLALHGETAIESPKALPLQEDEDMAEGEATPFLLPVICPGVSGHSSVSYTVNLPAVVEFWKRQAKAGGKYADPAFDLLALSAVHSLERVYQEAFGVEDTRKTQDRLLEWAVKLDAGKHFPLFQGKFHKEFARVTGVAIGHPYARVCLAELVYHRLPGEIYEFLKDINPMDERGWRQFSHSQFMTDNMHQHMREVVMTVTNQLANTPSKADDRKAYPALLKRLDKTLPRYKKRGYFAKSAQQKQQENG